MPAPLSCLWGPIFPTLTIALDVQSWGVAVREMYLLLPRLSLLLFLLLSVSGTSHSTQIKNPKGDLQAEKLIEREVAPAVRGSKSRH